MTVDPDRIYVVDGPIASTPAPSAAIDLCLHLVRAAHGADVANRVAREMVVPAHRSGGQAQYTPTPVADRAGRGAEALAELLDWAAGHLDADLSVDALAVRGGDVAAHLRPALRRGHRHHPRRLGARPAPAPRRGTAGTHGATIAAVARRCGFGSADTLRRHLHRARGVTPEQYRVTFRGA